MSGGPVVDVLDQAIGSYRLRWSDEVIEQILADPTDERAVLLLAIRLATTAATELPPVPDPESVKALRSAARKVGKLLGQSVQTHSGKGAFYMHVKDNNDLQQAVTDRTMLQALNGIKQQNPPPLRLV